ncbi:hypothetical protein DACRYDRAFT_114114 [Dacryopinax primogenitus]|uniref:BTB domain-containing protein n=1 Tax=Dacryopinax primogenitus (strain DJM 731) TaxID=1858805 RepID=M5G3I8_DACPD|nr:uncharacterized protein DACRYDRAFT_114114 [Dacryopinax primogenitus]EJU04791.1 hypothetical protein DACRYDRAFT_114114 [Dacryopinax primogenitus]
MTSSPVHGRSRSRPSSSPSIPTLFQQPTADIILLSSDRPAAELRVHRRILIEASEFFREMFTLPQPVRQDGSPEEEEIPKIDLQEPASVLIPLLTLLYPVPPPSFSSLDLLPALFRSAQKYDLPSLPPLLACVLREPRFLQAEPLQVYALACQFGLKEEARLASRATLRVDLMALLLPLPDKLGSMLAVDLVQLVALRVQRASQAKTLLKAPGALQGLRCISCGTLPSWVGEWRRRACVELDRYPVSETIFASSFLGEVIGMCGIGCGKCGIAKWESGEWERLRAEVDALPNTI